MRNCIKYLNHPNLLFIVKRSKKIDESEIINPNIINGFEVLLTFFCENLSFEDKDKDSSLSLLRRFEKGFITL